MLIQYFFAIYNSLCDGPSAESMQPASWTCLLLFRYSLFIFLFWCCSIEVFRKNDLETHTTNSFVNYYYCRTAPVPSIILPIRNWGTNDENDNILIWKSLSRLISRQSLLFFFLTEKLRMRTRRVLSSLSSLVHLSQITVSAFRAQKLQ